MKIKEYIYLVLASSILTILVLFLILIGLIKSEEHKRANGNQEYIYHDYPGSELLCFAKKGK